MNNLYKNLKKNNNLLIKETTGEYAIFLNTFVNKIRKYAIKSQATENTLKEIIQEIIDAYHQNIRFSSFIPSKEEYINDKLEKFTKAYKPKYSIKETIIITLCSAFLIGFMVLSIILKQPVDFETPKEVKVEEGIFYFQEVKYAKEYIIRCTNASGHILRDIYLDDEDPDIVNIQKYNLTTITELKEPGTYIIKVKVLSNNIYQDSKWSEETTYVNYG